MRDLKKETEWRKNKYKRLVVDVDKDIAEKFLKELEKKRKNLFRMGKRKYSKNFRKI